MRRATAPAAAAGPRTSPRRHQRPRAAALGAGAPRRWPHSQRCTRGPAALLPKRMRHAGTSFKFCSVDAPTFTTGLLMTAAPMAPKARVREVNVWKRRPGAMLHIINAKLPPPSESCADAA